MYGIPVAGFKVENVRPDSASIHSLLMNSWVYFISGLGIPAIFLYTTKTSLNEFRWTNPVQRTASSDDLSVIYRYIIEFSSYPLNDLPQVLIWELSKSVLLDLINS